MNTLGQLAPWLLLPSLGACAVTEQPPTVPHAANPASASSSRPHAATQAHPPAPTPARRPEPVAAKNFRDCGPLACKAFPSAEAAFDHVLATSPRVLAIGEAHAQSQPGSASASATRRFMAGLLPRLAPRASDLVIELWIANGKCGKVEQQVQKQQQAVTAPQAATNQNEFLELGHRAKALQIQPHALVPTCEQYAKISGAGAQDIEEMLAMLKSVTQRDVEELLRLRGPDRLIVAYGGAMHNDLVPRTGREPFSFGPELAKLTEGRYVELDLILPEQIKDSESWQAMPWYAHYDRTLAGAETYLYSWAPHAYALIFPKS